MQGTKKQNDHVMICHDTCYDVCHEVNNTHVICHDSDQVNQKSAQVSEQVNRISKEEWFYLVDTLESWRVFNPRAIVKKNPAAAWRCMNICKDRNVRVPGAYFTACFRTELAKQKAHKNFVDLLEKKCGVA